MTPEVARSVTAAPLPWQRLEEPGFHQRIARQPGRVMVVFGRKGCGACRRAHAWLPTLAVGLVDALVSVDADRSGGLVREFEVFHLPALFLYVDGRYHAPITCALSADALRAAVQSALARPALDPP